MFPSKSDNTCVPATKQQLLTYTSNVSVLLPFSVIAVITRVSPPLTYLLIFTVFSLTVVIVADSSLQLHVTFLLVAFSGSIIAESSKFKFPSITVVFSESTPLYNILIPVTGILVSVILSILFDKSFIASKSLSFASFISFCDSLAIFIIPLSLNTEFIVTPAKINSIIIVITKAIKVIPF